MDFFKNHQMTVEFTLAALAVATFFFLRKHHRPLQQQRETFTQQFRADLARLYCLLYKGSTPDNEQEQLLIALVQWDADTPRLLPLVNHLHASLRPRMDALGLYVDGGTRGRTYPLLENIAPALRRDGNGLMMLTIPGEHRIGFDLSYAVKNTKSEAATKQPARPVAKPVAKRQAELHNQHPLTIELA